MSKEKLPQESDSQEVGHHATFAFKRWHPKDWRLTPTEDVSDVGLDYQVQVISTRGYESLFHAQIKGSRQKTKDGSNKRLSADKAFYSQELKISTLNYYAKIDTPVMLVFADLAQHSNPRECKIYYLWIDEELEKLLQGHDNLDYLKKGTHTFKIPVTNVLNDEVDVLPYLKDRFEKRRALEGLYGKVAEYSQEPVSTVKDLTGRISNKTILASVLQPTDNPWIDAPKGSIAESLHKAFDYVKANNAPLAQAELDKLAQRLTNATELERADYYYQHGKLQSLIGDFVSGLENYKKAHEICPANKKYRLAYLEAKLNSDYDNKDVCQEILSEVEPNKEIEYIRLKAKALAFMRDKKAIEILDGHEEKQVIVARALVYLLMGEYKKCKEVCDHALAEVALEPASQFVIYLFRARAFFCLGFGNSQVPAGHVIPFTGIPSMNDGIMRQCWDDVIRAWDIGKELGYPTDLAYSIDMSCILGIYFGDIERIYSHIKRFAEIRPNCSEVQEALLRIALHTRDHKTANKQISIIGETPDTVVCWILSEYDQNNRKQVVELTLEKLEYLKKAQPTNFDTVLLSAAECANELVLDEAKDRILKEIESLPNSKDILAAYEFYETLSRSQLAKHEAVLTLYSHFEEGCHDKQVLSQLIRNLDSKEKKEAKKLIKVSKVLQTQIKLGWGDLLRVCESLYTIADWAGLLTLVESAFERFGKEPRLIAIKAMALDAAGDTPKALDLLEESSYENMSDTFALEIYTNIWMRCGFVERAHDLVTKMLEKAENSKRKLHLIRMLLLLEMNINPVSPKLLSYCEKYGQINDRNNEEEEGNYLQMVFLVDLSTKRKPTEQQKSDFPKRLKTFTEHFPNSKYLKAIQVRKDAPPEEILLQLDKATGMTDSIREQYRRNETLIKSGQLPIPFPVRHRYLLNVCDLLHLWQISKIAGVNNKQYHLVLEYGMYRYRSSSELNTKIPLIDEISLLVLNDLGLLDKLFDVFGKIAIAKSTIIRFQNWGQHVISTFSPIAKTITAQLKEHIHSIYQPSFGSHNITDIRFPDLNEYKDIVRNNKDILFYSDDAPSRFIVYENNYDKEGMTSLDLIKILRERGTISDLDAATKISILCSWNVVGIPVQYIDILRVISEEFTGNEKLKNTIDKLESHNEFNYFINYIWDFEKPYEVCLNEIGSFVSLMISGEGGLHVANNIIGAIWYMWSFKVMLKLKAELNKLAYLARSFCIISLQTLNRIKDQSKSLVASQRLWSIYKELTEFVFGNDMTDDIHNESISLLAQFTVNTHPSIRDKAYGFIEMGLISGTSDAILFEKSYQTAAFERDKKAGSSRGRR